MMEWDDIRQAMTGLVANQRDLSRLCGCQGSLVSSAKARGRKPTLNALTHLHVTLSRDYDTVMGRIQTGTPISPEDRQQAGMLWQAKEWLGEEIRRRVINKGEQP
ncbi:MAG TPA: hypothetical protein VK196_18180 [Magnetospirillum sp.]|nr:hypothetical protein [Magnetospirillum sp.]